MEELEGGEKKSEAKIKVCLQYIGYYIFFKGGTDGEIKLWNLETNKYSESFIGHSGPITCIECATNGAFTVTAAEDKKVKVWSMTLAMVITNYEVCHQICILI